MMEVLQFIFQDIWHFIGTVMLIEAIMYPIGIAFAERKGRR